MSLILINQEINLYYSNRQKEDFQLTERGWIYPNSQLTQDLLVRDTLQVQLNEELKYNKT